MPAPEQPAAPLPRGRHRLSREDVARSQRRRILLALADTMAERGYAATSVADVLAAAGVSRSTFYELFTSKEDAFMSAFEEAVGTVVGPGVLAPPTDAPPLEQFGHVLRAYLDGLAAAPGYARLFLVEVYAAGPEAAQRRALVLERYADAVADLFGARTAEDRFAARALVAATSMMATVALTKGDLDELRALHGPVMDLATRLAPS